MLSIHFNKQVFINSLKANDSMVYAITTIALMATLLLQGTIKGNLKPEYFVYALVVSVAFCTWGIIDRKFRKMSAERQKNF
ncbi:MULTISPECIES: hypothetical protein [Acinetobacter]|uniref:Uncharacterized protein n=2 Tax=Acinetobacter beijerinckii TaxID=262668 RepID=N9E3S4_9GAMM|nr:MULTISPECIES: hypothetical protein [Acinetobacter]MBC9228382.1 hypothetical protein [Acinetobacter baumannii]ENW05113.1 hypothetical protein F934_01845 [Acinetobacter beijerinckii ANC 3835]ENW07887.1 hypothetical protein F933_01083 [Acinetobacter beijerinckii CIP 110307]MDF2416391.1 hypothetical protein [Acinetobacter beijerinckii]UTO20953.1 hypothetical protein NGC85_07700 [Acinetobacter sp. Z1]